MADLLQEIEAQIAGAKATAAKHNVGVIREVGDGVARIEGLTDAMLNEMIDLGHGITGLGYRLTPRWGSKGKKRPPAASQMSNLQGQAGKPDLQGFPAPLNNHLQSLEQPPQEPPVVPLV